MRKLVLLFSLPVFLLAISGCTTGTVAAGLLAGGTAAGYYTGRDERDLATIKQDAVITSTIKGWFLSDKEINGLHINVDTYRGVVTLYGSVENKHVEESAMRMASKANGVTKVVSKLTVINEADGSAARPAAPSNDGVQTYGY